MSTILSIAASIVGAGLVAFVLYYIRRSVSNEVDLAQRTAALQVETEHVEALERATAAERQKRLKELDDQKAKVRTPDDAARFLRSQLSGPGKSPADKQV